MVLCAALISISGSVSEALAGPIVSDGGFENPTVSNFYYQLYDSGQTFGGWTVGQGRVALTTDTFNPPLSITAFQGNQFLQLAGIGGTNGSVYQDLATTRGQAYILSFAFTGNPDNQFPETIKRMELDWNGGKLDTLAANITGHSFANPGWTVFSYDVVANSKTTRLEFINVTPGSSAAGPLIDDVQLAPSAVPEPSSVVLAGVGLVASFFGRRRRATGKK